MGIFRKIWAVYGVLVLTVIVLVSFPIYFILFVFFGKRGRLWAIWFSHNIIAKLYFILTLIRVKVAGRENLEPDKSYIIVSNHSSTIDFMANALASPNLYVYLIKKELTKIPFLGYILRKMSVVVDRSNAESRKESIAELKRTLADGFSIFLYPEGTRNKTNELLTPFYNGAFMIALDTETPIVVQTMTNIKSISATKNLFDLSPGVLHIVFDKPIPVKGATIDELKEKVKQTMLKHLKTKD